MREEKGSKNGVKNVYNDLNRLCISMLPWGCQGQNM